MVVGVWKKSYCGRASDDGRLLAVGWKKVMNGVIADEKIFLGRVLALCGIVVRYP